ncbi:MAG: YbaN family protein [Spirochaetes bacterium]|nr:YbaN family protein [Spirochaetota bacterium]
MLKIIYIALGTISLGLGIIGIFLPGLPTTPFLLLSAALYVRSSQRLYHWLIEHKWFGGYIKNFQERKAMTLKAKILSLFMMWSMIICSVVFFVNNIYIKYLLFGLAIVGTISIILIPTYKDH